MRQLSILLNYQETRSRICGDSGATHPRGPRELWTDTVRACPRAWLQLTGERQSVGARQAGPAAICSPAARRRARRVAVLAGVWDGKRSLSSRPGVVLVLADEPTLDCYHGGGKLALANSRAKAPNGWRFCLSMLPPSAQNALETWVSSGALPADIAGYAKSAPASSWSELTMSSRGLFGAYASDLLTWE